MLKEGRGQVTCMYARLQSRLGDSKVKAESDFPRDLSHITCLLDVRQTPGRRRVHSLQPVKPRFPT